MTLDVQGRRVLVLGLGVSGAAAARHLLDHGATVVAADRSTDAHVREAAVSIPGAEAHLGDDGAALVVGADLVVASPGVPPSAPALVAARAAGVPVWSEIELAFRMARAPIVGITGTNGKTTTTQMTAAALAAAGYRTAAAGNIGTPLTDVAARDLDVIVAELSSFQLQHVETFRARVGVLLNLADDHLDWHGGFDAYVAAKARLFERQGDGDVAVHLDDEVCAAATRGAGGRRVPFAWDRLPDGGAGVVDGRIVVPEGAVLDAARLRVRGRPALANAVAAAAAACAFGASPEAVGEALAAFEPQAHRFEWVATVGGVEFVNDSKATNPHATLAALEGATRVVLIAGGRNKGVDLGALRAGAASVRAVVAIGEAADDVIAALASVPAERATTMEEAVERAAVTAMPGDTVLLSPACASFDMFADYKARGEAFRAAVKRLAEREGDDR